MTTNDKKEKDDKSHFNFFAILEDTIEGVIEFVVKFIKVTFICIFKPKKFISDYKNNEAESRASLSRAYTYLIFCIFLFVKGISYVNIGTTNTDEIKTLGFGLFIEAAHELVAKAGEITTFHIFLNVFPAFIVILISSFLMGLVFKSFVNGGYRETSHIFSYVFGSQIIGALIIVLLIKLLRFYGETGNIAAIFGSFFLSIGLFSSAVISLKTWFDISLKNKYINSLSNVVYVILVGVISVSYFGAIVNAREKLETKMIYGEVVGDNISQRIESELSVTIFDVELSENKLSLTLLFNNRGKNDYYISREGSMHTIGGYGKIVDEIFNEFFDENDNIIEGKKTITKNLKNKLKTNKMNFFRVDLKGKTKNNIVVEGGGKSFIQYYADITGRGIKKIMFYGDVKIPVARLNNNGEFSYSSLNKSIDYKYKGMITRFTNEKKSNDEAYDYLVKTFNLGLEEFISEQIKK